MATNSAHVEEPTVTILQSFLDQDDILIWQDGTWCYRHELHEMNHMSDDYEIFYYWSEGYDKVCADVGAT